MILPRVASFKTGNQRAIPLTHIVMVEGTDYKAVCVRQPIRQGVLVAPGVDITCRSCSRHGWIYTLGNLSSTPVPTNREGRWISREEAAARLSRTSDLLS
jgi:hypothetical protein